MLTTYIIILKDKSGKIFKDSGAIWNGVGFDYLIAWADSKGFEIIGLE
jgi:hypothetical protein